VKEKNSIRVSKIMWKCIIASVYWGQGPLQESVEEEVIEEKVLEEEVTNPDWALCPRRYHNYATLAAQGLDKKRFPLLTSAATPIRF